MSLPYLVLIPLIVGITSQLLKILIEALKKKRRIHWRSLDKYGGMPSSHAAILSSLITLVALIEGFNSFAFAICLIISLIMIRDAYGFRVFLETQGKILNKFLERLPKQERKEFPAYRPAEIGHRVSEIAAGLLLGIGLTLFLYSLLIKYLS